MRTKNDIRSEIKRQRASLTPAWIKTHSAAIQQHVMQWDQFLAAKSIGCYQHFSAEVQARQIIAAAFDSGKSVACPKQDEAGHYRFADYHPEQLVTGALGISEPQKPNWTAPASIDLILLPGLAVDRHGNRIGFGFGHIDHMLSENPAPKAFLAFDFQVVEEIPHEAHDVRMDFIVTPEGIQATKPNPSSTER